MKNIKGSLLVAAFLLLYVTVSAQSHQEKYIERYAQVAVYEMYRSGIPASITLAQGLLESGYGQSELARKSNNHFGIKCHNGWQGGRVYHDDENMMIPVIRIVTIRISCAIVTGINSFLIIR